MSAGTVNVSYSFYCCTDKVDALSLVARFLQRPTIHVDRITLIYMGVHECHLVPSSFASRSCSVLSVKRALFVHPQRRGTSLFHKQRCPLGQWRFHHSAVRWVRPTSFPRHLYLIFPQTMYLCRRLQQTTLRVTLPPKRRRPSSTRPIPRMPSSRFRCSPEQCNPYAGTQPRCKHRSGRMWGRCPLPLW